MSAVSMLSLEFGKGDVVVNHITGNFYMILGYAFFETNTSDTQVLYIKCDIRGFVSPEAKMFILSKTHMYDGTFSLFHSYEHICQT